MNECKTCKVIEKQSSKVKKATSRKAQKCSSKIDRERLTDNICIRVIVDNPMKRRLEEEWYDELMANFQ
uniref:Uncharacterized protein n=1 Tax=Onchocerca volvulus TaxID=6282 RepID=A0A8R1TNQ7_ONCVO